MNEANPKLEGPDFTQGVALSSLEEGRMLLGHAHGEPAILVRRRENVFAIGAICTHYGAPLAEGVVVEDSVRCPWHHACFSLHSGDALRPPALNPVTHWRVEQRDGNAYVREKLAIAKPQPATLARGLPASIVIVGGAAAGNAAAEEWRRPSYTAITRTCSRRLNSRRQSRAADRAECRIAARERGLARSTRRTRDRPENRCNEGVRAWRKLRSMDWDASAEPH